MVSKPAIALLVGLVVGVVVGNGALVGAVVPQSVGGDDPYDTPGYSLSLGGPSCYDEPTANAGWVHEVANGDYYGVTLNATVVHAPDRRVTVDVSERTPDTYEIAIRTRASDADEDERAKQAVSECDRVATDVGVGTGLPTDYRRAVVTMDGRKLLSFENEDTAADLYRLPNPVNATATDAS
jgi:hypothetical protein